MLRIDKAQGSHVLDPLSRGMQMNNNWIPLQSIPAGGKTLVFTDQALWLGPCKEFGIACRIETPLRAEVFVLPQDQGVLFRGSISGKVALPCDRCADDSLISLTHTFDSFEPYPAESLASAAKDSSRASASRKTAERADSPDEDEIDGVDAAVIRNAIHGKGIEINPAALVWEEFSLALPVKPLCTEACRGLCPVCGKNRNNEPCACSGEQGDPRLAILRGLNIKKKQ